MDQPNGVFQQRPWRTVPEADVDEQQHHHGQEAEHPQHVEAGPAEGDDCNAAHDGSSGSTGGRVAWLT